MTSSAIERMHRGLTALLGFFCTAFATIATFAEEPQQGLKLVAGEESTLLWPSLKNDSIIVRLPDSWTPTRKWPVIFYYHGTGGQPTIALPRAYTGGDHFVIVGMTYTVKGTVKASDSSLFYSETFKIFTEVRDHLAKVAAVNPERSYVGGFSKGGWAAAHFADKYPLSIAGAMILGAGVNPLREGEELPRLRKNTPVYVGVGQLEFNYAVSLQAIDHYGKRGARVTLDVYDGLGHRPAGDPRSDHLEQWLIVETYRDNLKELKPVFENWFTRLNAKTGTTADPVLRYLLLERAGNGPFARFLNGSQRRIFSAQLEALRQQSAVASEWELRSRYEATRRAESDGGFRLANWEAVILDYATVYRRGPQSTFGRRAGLDALRVLDSIKEAIRQRKKGGRATGGFLEKNSHLVTELEAIPRTELITFFKELRKTLTIPVLEQ
ncbi:MAG: putative esterase [Verrucomicrobiales bacterium]|jgi:predicted esterase